MVLDRTGKIGRGRPVPAQAVASLRHTMPVGQVHRIGLPCDLQGCAVKPRISAVQQCPYSPEVLRRDPTPDEQRAARREARCDGLGGLYRYFQYSVTDTFTLVIDRKRSARSPAWRPRMPSGRRRPWVPARWSSTTHATCTTARWR